MKNVLKVVNFPGAPITIEVEGNISAKGAFEMAGVDYSGRELKYNGQQVGEYDIVNGGMLIAMKRIKGNSRAVKVVLFPGMPVSVEVESTTTIGEVFAKAGFDITNKELKVDGRLVDTYDEIGEGRMAIGMTKIKGNARFSEGDLVFMEDEEYLEMMYEGAPEIGRITDMEEDMIAVDDYYMDREFVEANFKLDVTEEERVANEKTHQIIDTTFVAEDGVAKMVVELEPHQEEVEEHTCECDCIKTRAEEKLAELNGRAQQIQDMIDMYFAERVKIQEKIELIESVLTNPVG